MERSATSFGRRILAVLFRDGINLYAKDLDDPIKNVYYTAAIWNMWLCPSLNTALALAFIALCAPTQSTTAKVSRLR